MEYKNSHAISTLAADSVMPKPEEDDFGDFEEAQAEPQGTSPAQSQSKASTFHSIIPAITENITDSLDVFRTSSDTIDGDMHRDPWACVESLGKPIIPRSRAENIENNAGTDQGKLLTGSTSRLVETSVEVPHGAEEWGEFSPDPREAVQHSSNSVFFDTGKTSTPAKTSGNVLPRTSPAGKETALKKASKIIRSIPPTNVPPPSILLSFLSNLVIVLPAHVTKIAAQGQTPKANSTAVSKAQANCHLSFRVAARVITGRKLRWKRDAHLSQSMKIGPASAGRAGGMKLTGVDKAEAQREDREAVEIVRVWKATLGGIRAALTASNGQARGQSLGLPDMSEKMLVRTATAAEGALTATKCCFLCGLKRDERVTSLDAEVSDTFGEWWTEHWGHAECQTFWEQYEGLLLKRG